jgi:crotonobetainyl-CoA:carnitine CoA-transferase CaiB-like acyl-CoA transferase
VGESLPQRLSQQEHVQALDGVRVVEWTEALAGPYCAMLLGDLGASVIKVERPKTGDQSRGWGPPFAGSESAYFLSANRNKRSLTLNLNHPRGVGILRDLIARADVFIHNQPRPESLLKRGLDYQSAAAANPLLVYCAISGYGSTGPKTGLPGYDILAQGEAGIMSITGEPGDKPMRYPIAIADVTCGIYAAMGILAALLVRERLGKGQFLDLSLRDSQLTWLVNVGSSYLNAGDSPKRHGNAHPSIVPYQLFQARDDRYLMVAVGTEALWARFCRVLGIEKTIGGEARFSNNRLRIENRAELIPLLEKIFRTNPIQDWLNRFREAEIPAGPVNTVEEALRDPQTLARHAIIELEHPLIGVARSIANPIKMSATPVLYRFPPPLLGEHNTAILYEAGISNDEFAKLQREGVI